MQHRSDPQLQLLLAQQSQQYHNGEEHIDQKRFQPQRQQQDQDQHQQQHQHQQEQQQQLVYNELQQLHRLQQVQIAQYHQHAMSATRPVSTFLPLHTPAISAPSSSSPHQNSNLQHSLSSSVSFPMNGYVPFDGPSTSGDVPVVPATTASAALPAYQPAAQSTSSYPSASSSALNSANVMAAAAAAAAAAVAASASTNPTHSSTFIQQTQPANTSNLTSSGPSLASAHDPDFTQMLTSGLFMTPSSALPSLYFVSQNTPFQQPTPQIGSGASTLKPQPVPELQMATAYRIGRYTRAERNLRLERYREKRLQRNYNRRVKYNCRKDIADKRYRVQGRFVKRETEEALAAEKQVYSNGTNPSNMAVSGQGQSDAIEASLTSSAKPNELTAVFQQLPLEASSESSGRDFAPIADDDETL